VRRATAIFGANHSLCSQGPFRLLRRQHTVAGAIGIIRACHSSDRPHQGDFPVVVPVMEFGEDGVILTKYGLFGISRDSELYDFPGK